MKKLIQYYTFGIMFFMFSVANAQIIPENNQFRQLSTLLPDANVYRTASGAPGFKYWQQKADYKIKLELNDDNQSITGEETITYYNQSPDNLDYLWIQLDQNIRAKNSLRIRAQSTSISKEMSAGALRYLNYDFDGGFKIKEVIDAQGNKLHYVINETMMRIDLPKALKSGENFTFDIKWSYNINNRALYRGRSGMEYFEKDGNYLYVIAQFYPRMALYTDYAGWQNKQFLGSGEFTLTFGDFDVEITVPDDFIVAATGVLINKEEVLSTQQLARLEKAKNAESPVLIVTQKEAEKAEKNKSKNKKTWKFKAENVRDFAFAGSRKFIWDAMGVHFGNRTVMAMSFYPKEGNPLWEKYSTRAVAHTLKTYSHFTFDYPYPVAQSIHADRIGMEYPMICFNGGRPEPDGTYSKRTKYGMLGVIIHEVGHNFFPMIVNSDERQWTWMDEGLNTFLQYQTEQAWEKGFPSRTGGSPQMIVDYMRTNKTELTPVMINPDIAHFHHQSQYSKVAAALSMLRETVMGRELFDYAFKEYANRWKFKHPTPADFFRTMEDASAVDLDWFWRGWFYSTDHVDLAIENVQMFKLANGNPAEEKAWKKKQKNESPVYIKDIRDEDLKTIVEKDPSMKDFYNSYDPYLATQSDKEIFKQFTASLTNEEKKFIDADNIYLQIDVKNIGGIVMPLILKLEYTDGIEEVVRIPAEIWRYNNNSVSKVLVVNKPVKEVVLDPFAETADTDMQNNYWPPRIIQSRFELYKSKNYPQKNPMQKKKNK
jgi:hypothetical protein